MIGLLLAVVAGQTGSVGIVSHGALKDFRVVPALGELRPVPLPHEALPAAADLGLVERANVQRLLQVQVVGKQRPEGDQVPARELARGKGQLFLCPGVLPGLMMPVPVSVVMPVMTPVALSILAGRI